MSLLLYSIPFIVIALMVLFEIADVNINWLVF